MNDFTIKKMFSCFFWTVPFVTGEPRSVSEHFRDLPVHLRHHWSFVLSFGINFLFRLRICLFLLTLFGIVPESALGILGHLDYFLVAAMILICACILYRDFFVQAWKTVCHQCYPNNLIAKLSKANEDYEEDNYKDIRGESTVHIYNVNRYICKYSLPCFEKSLRN